MTEDGKTPTDILEDTKGLASIESISVGDVACLETGEVGEVKYVGPIPRRIGIYAGLDLIRGLGKNDGAYDGKRYFETTGENSGIFVPLLSCMKSRILSSSNYLKIDDDPIESGTENQALDNSSALHEEKDYKIFELEQNYNQSLFEVKEELQGLQKSFEHQKISDDRVIQELTSRAKDREKIFQGLRREYDSARNDFMFTIASLKKSNKEMSMRFQEQNNNLKLELEKKNRKIEKLEKNATRSDNLSAYESNLENNKLRQTISQLNRKIELFKSQQSEVTGLKVIIDELSQSNIALEDKLRFIKTKLENSSKVDASSREILTVFNDNDDVSWGRSESNRSSLLKYNENDSPDIIFTCSNKLSSNPTKGQEKWCEVCETSGHDILECEAIFDDKQGVPNH